MLSTRHRFLFLHIPKTGGNSIQDRLRDLSDDRLVCLGPHQDGVERFELRSERYATHKHSTLAEYRSAYGAELFDGLRRFTCVRNPWDRVLSFFFSPHRGPVTFSTEAFMRFIPSVPPMRHYLALPDDAEPTLACAAGNVHHLLRFERLQTEFDALCVALGLPAQPLARRNQSAHAHYRDYYDDTCRRLVEERFGDEAEVFGYRF